MFESSQPLINKIKPSNHSTEKRCRELVLNFNYEKTEDLLSSHDTLATTKKKNPSRLSNHITSVSYQDNVVPSTKSSMWKASISVFVMTPCAKRKPRHEFKETETIFRNQDMKLKTQKPFSEGCHFLVSKSNGQISTAI